MPSAAADDLWTLVLRPGPVDAAELWRAVLSHAKASPGADDYRTRLLVRDALDALAERWGPGGLEGRLTALDEGGARIRQLWRTPFDEVGFATLRRRLVNATSRETILQLLRELGQRVRGPANVTVGGSSALVLADLVVRQTDDVDLVDELPEAVRAEPALVDELAARYGLRLIHFASHYLPAGWRGRAASLGRMGRLAVHVLDPLDVLCGKLFSRRTKDLDDVRAAWPAIDRAALRQRLIQNAAALRSDPKLAEAAAHNWYILTGESALP